MRIAVHRGGGAGSLQNKIDGIRKALQVGADIVEIDVHFSSDGVAFLYHDRWINGKNIYDYRSQELESLGLERLEDALHMFDTTFYIDLKQEPNEKFFEVISGYDVIIGSFNGILLQRISELGFPTSLILSTVVPPEDIDELVSSVGARYVNLSWEHHLPQNYIEILSKINTPVISWTENNDEVFRELLDVVDVVMTDRLDLVRKYGRQRQ